MEESNIMKKRINVTIGYKIVEDGKPTRYFADLDEEWKMFNNK